MRLPASQRKTGNASALPVSCGSSPRIACAISFRFDWPGDEAFDHAIFRLQCRLPDRPSRQVLHADAGGSRTVLEDGAGRFADLFFIEPPDVGELDKRLQ